LAKRLCTSSVGSDAARSAWQDQVDHVRALMDAFAPPNPTPLDLDKPASEEPTDDHKP
jgi:hypothetical protein